MLDGLIYHDFCLLLAWILGRDDIRVMCVCVCVCACVCVYVCVLYIGLVKSRYLLKLPGFLRVAFSKEEGEVSLASPLHVSSRTNLIST